MGKYWRNRPLVFSLVPRCQGLCGSAKKTGMRGRPAERRPSVGAWHLGASPGQYGGPTRRVAALISSQFAPGDTLRSGGPAKGGHRHRRFIRLAQSPGLTAEEQVTFTGMKQALADQLMRARPAASDALDEE